MGLKRTLIYLVIALVVWRAGSPVLRYVFGLLSSGLGALFGSSGSATADPTSLRAAIRNVTTDYDQVKPIVGLQTLLETPLSAQWLFSRRCTWRQNQLTP